MSRTHLSKVLTIAGLALLTACGSARPKTIQFRAIKDSRDPLPCMIVVDDRWPETQEQASFTTQNDGKVTIDYSNRNAVTVKLVPVEFDAAGNLLSFPKTGEDNSRWRCVPNPRDVEYTDRSPLLFIFSPRIDT